MYSVTQTHPNTYVQLVDPNVLIDIIYPCLSNAIMLLTRIP